MGTLAALLVATPVWGFALQPPLAMNAIAPEIAAQLAATADPELALAPREDPLQQEKIQWTRAIVFSTALAMATTAVIGAIQFADEYGFHDSYYDTACAQGTGVFDRCGEEVPWQHAVAAGITAGGLIFATLKSFFIDFDGVARVDSDWRIYETTRWVALGMGVVQAIAGVLISNAVRFGWADQVEDFDTLQALAIGHLAFGAATLGVQVANSILLF
ncbi:hypothetical protein [Sandaracinus amylolyticus]|uniref:hypothetical protein n=1 Tax=Sandaracinus amylolyticus TaxID=927083 RepID=UPI001F2A9FAC|nr:hypothetical protein [Sandaracinus amylolyticus]UJR83138.1 Hypothetical protein I5071_52040 [Sandaracinus amylolyticus]